MLSITLSSTLSVSITLDESNVSSVSNVSTGGCSNVHPTLHVNKKNVSRVNHRIEIPTLHTMTVNWANKASKFALLKTFTLTYSKFGTGFTTM